MKEIKEGYKMTELGEIPNEWQVEKLEGLFQFKNGLNKEKEFFGKGTPIVNYTDVYKKRGLKRKDIQGKVTVTEKEIENFKVNRGDVFFTRTSETIEEIGLTSVILEEVQNTVFSGFVLRGRPTTSKLNIDYCKYCFSTSNIRNEIKRKSSYTTRALTSGTSLNGVFISIPPRPEQQKIADILSTVDEQIDNVDRLIEKTKELKKGLMQQLLTKGIGHTEFKETEVGVIPKEWEVKKLGEISTFINGRAYKQTEFRETGTPIIRIQNLTGEGQYVYSDLQLEDDKYINSGDLIYAWSATFGPFIWNGEKGIYHYHIWKVLCNEDVLDKRFYFYRLSYISTEMNSKKNGSAFSHITKGFMEAHNIALPSKAEQMNIAKILDGVEDKLNNYLSKKDKLQQLKKGLMQQLLTGKIRVK